jgi:hypothetical protein
MTAPEALRKWRGNRTTVIAAAIFGMPHEEYLKFEGGGHKFPDWLLKKIGVVRAKSRA